MGQGACPLWGVGATPRLGGIGSGATFAGRSPLPPARARYPIREAVGVTCYTTFVNQAAVIALLSRQPIYSLSPPPASRVARPQAVSVLPLDSAPAPGFFFFSLLILPGCSWTAIQALAARWLPPLICDQLTLPKAAPLDSPTS